MRGDPQAPAPRGPQGLGPPLPLTLQGVDVSSPGVVGILLHILFRPRGLREKLVLDEFPVEEIKIVHIRGGGLDGRQWKWLWPRIVLCCTDPELLIKLPSGGQWRHLLVTL